MPGLDGIPIPYRLRRTEMQQSPQGDWYVNMTEEEKIVGIDYESSSIRPENFGGGGGGSGYYKRKPVIWILTNEIVTEVMGT